jgi:mono/diheme cytochrome c family protein
LGTVLALDVAMSRTYALGVSVLIGGVSALASSACSGAAATPTDSPADPTDVASAMHRYVDDPEVGRKALEHSLVRHDNGYAALRLARYDEQHWGALPERDDPSMPIGVGEGGAPAKAPPRTDASWATINAAAVGWSLEELRALGERAFFRYPLQATGAMEAALTSEDHAGIWQSDGHYGAVWESLPNGQVHAAVTCATCHASKVGDRLVAGRNNADLDASRIYSTDPTPEPGAIVDPPAKWGRGLVDVTPDGIVNPVTITDLRPIRHQRNLHHAATLHNDDPVALAVRIETLMITSQGQLARPPRKIAAGLAVYLLSLAPETPLPQGEGADVFARECGTCHSGEGASGPPVALAAIGTDPTVGSSPDRGTGFYRVPSLRMVGDRRRMFASGAIEDIDALLAPDRAVAGHRYGLGLDARERASLLSYLRKL